MKKVLLLLVIMIVLSASLSAQHKTSFIEVDKGTYRAYLNKDWNKVIKTGRLGLANNIDYYYLRLRIGYAYYIKKQYRQAIHHYKKALEFSSRDATAMEYLYYSYLYGDRKKDAELLIKKFTPALKKYLNTYQVNPISEISFFGTYVTGATAFEKETVNNGISQTLGLDGSQILPNNFNNFNLNISHRLGNNVTLNHSINLLNKNEYSLAIVDGIAYLSEEQIIRQFTYGLSIDVTPVSGLTITPSATYINYRIPIFTEYGAGYGKNRTIYNYKNQNEGAYSLKINQQLGLFSLSVTAGYSNLNSSQQTTGSFSVTFYPLGNLNLYYTAIGYYHMQSQNNNTLNQFIQSHKLGFKVTKNLWIEGYILMGPFNNFQDPYSGITYNSLETYQNIYGGNLYLPFSKKKLSIYLGFRNIQSNAAFVPIDNVFESYNNILFHYQTYTGGIIWKL